MIGGERKVYVIHKTSRAPNAVSYSGPTWDYAGIRIRYREQYADKKEAEALAKTLTKSNPVGFVVTAGCLRSVSCSRTAQ